MQNLFLVAAVICFGMAAIKLYTARMTPNRQEGRAASAAKKAGYGLLTPEEAQARLSENESVILLDVRTQEEYDGGHIPGAVCLPVEMIAAGMPFALDKDAEIMVYCQSGARSAQAAERLAGMGYSRVFDLGGLQDWPGELTTEE